MAENLSSSTSVSKNIYADIKSAFRSYTQNTSKITTNEEPSIYKNNVQITRKAYYDAQNSLAARKRSTDRQNTEQTKKEEQQNTLTTDVNKTQAQEKVQEKTEIKNFTLPKNTQTIISELKRNGLRHTLSPYDIAKEYGISYMKAREVLDEANKDNNGFVREYKLPENSTVSYKV